MPVGQPVDNTPKDGELSSDEVTVWREMVHNPNITNKEIKDAYKDFAEGYDDCFNTIHPNRAEHMVQELTKFVKMAGKKVSEVKVLDVAAGTGIVGKALWDAGFRHITACDFSAEMLEVARKKGGYEKFVCSEFSNVLPEGIDARSYDCVIMTGGFAAGHVPLSSLHTMARICKKGGIVINSMTLQYSHFVDEYKNIDRYVQELGMSGVWKVHYRMVIEDYIKGKQGLIHAMQPI